MGVCAQLIDSVPYNLPDANDVFESVVETQTNCARKKLYVVELRLCTVNPPGLTVEWRNIIVLFFLFSVIGALANFEKFSEAFKCPSESTMNPSKKCAVW